MCSYGSIMTYVEPIKYEVDKYYMVYANTNEIGRAHV